MIVLVMVLQVKKVFHFILNFRFFKKQRCRHIRNMEGNCRGFLGWTFYWSHDFHSFGCGKNGRALLGNDVSGADLVFHPVAKKMIENSIASCRLNLDPEVKLNLYWGPDWTYSQHVLKVCIDTFYITSPEIEVEN
ncbi:hypothetical protein [Psychrobacillus sp. OK032]|uniref:hypothetical protein n=1 Tax=Psychrobacillus sp. OK032 TaxID=1884358 RepID=UPI001160933D|nr:hypothetical protein [Psychrobacillus sp. OK032]